MGVGVAGGEVYGSVRVKRKNPKNTWQNYAVKAAEYREKDAWKDMMGTKNEIVQERCM